MATDITLTDEDRACIRGVLLGWRADGVERPLVPLDVDIDGDGVVDAFGLDDHDEVVLVSGATLGDTVYRSDGDDLDPESA